VISTCFNESRLKEQAKNRCCLAEGFVKLTATIICQAGLPGEFSTFVLTCQGSATLVITHNFEKGDEQQQHVRWQG
jgi:hypothetical protein